MYCRMKRLFIVLACFLLPLVALPAQELKKEWKNFYIVVLICLIKHQPSHYSIKTKKN